MSAHARRQQVRFARERGLSCRRACALLRVARSALDYEAKRPARDEKALASLKSVASKYPRYGYRRALVLLGREGVRMNAKRAFRLWRTAGLSLPKRKSRRRVRQGQSRGVVALAVNAVWAMDFVHDACANGQKLKCLTLLDEHTKECLAIDVGRSIRATRVVEVLSQQALRRGLPKHVRCDNGPEFIAHALRRWAEKNGVTLAFSPPGKPWHNGTCESFNGKLRDECLDMEWFHNRDEAVVVIEGWRRHYNEERPHSSIGNQTPAQFAARLCAGFTHGPEITPAAAGLS